MSIRETHTALGAGYRRGGAGPHAPRLSPLEVVGLAVAIIMALGPLAAYAVGLGL